MIVLNQDTSLDILTTELAVGGVFNGAKAALYTNDLTPARGSLVGAFTYTDFAGLTNLKAITWGTPVLNASQQAEVLGNLLTWLTVTDPDPEVTAYGWIMTNAAGTAWILAERFAVPYVFNQAAQAFSLVPRLVHQ